MKKFLIEWETDFCEEWPEQRGEMLVTAETEEQAIKSAVLPFHAVIIGISEVK